MESLTMAAFNPLLTLRAARNLGRLGTYPMQGLMPHWWLRCPSLPLPRELCFRNLDASEEMVGIDFQPSTLLPW